jgi:formylglycine-generating enzyme
VRLFVIVLCACAAPAELVSIPGATYTMGDPPREPAARVTVAGFRLMRHEVTNRQFAAFVTETGFVTDAERSGQGAVWDGAWRRVRGADWRHPRGPGSSITGLDDHPVVQVSQRDAAAFCAHRGMRLPTEAEWELAARGTDGRRYPWGNDPPRQRGRRRANFGTDRCCAADAQDGARHTAPIGAYPEGASPYGLLDMAGNVWERTSDAFAGKPGFVAIRGGGWGNDAYGLRVSYRHANPPDLGLDHVGFRCAADGEVRGSK